MWALNHHLITEPYELTITETIQQRRYQMLVHSYLYYQLNENIVDDHTFDRWAKELVELQEKYPEESKETRYHVEFQDFDGSSGFGLPYTQPNIQAMGNRLIRRRILTNEV